MRLQLRQDPHLQRQRGQAEPGAALRPRRQQGQPPRHAPTPNQRPEVLGRRQAPDQRRPPQIHLPV